MANLIKFKRGAEASIPVLADGEAGWTTDTFRLYIGQGGVNKLVGEADFLKKAGGAMTGALTLSGAPTQDLHAATKAYVDGLVQGINAKASVKAATTAGITLSGTQTIDGIALAVGDRALVKNQATASQNGIYLVAAGAWTRAADADSWADLVSLFTWVEQGTASADSGWLCSVDAGGTLGTTAVTFVQFSGAGQITAGAGLTKTGNTLDVGAGHGIQVDADAITVKLDGATLTKGASGLKITAAGVTATELAAAVAGNGLTGGAGTALAVGAGTGITVAADSISVNYGTTNVTACVGNDARLSDARTPVAHVHGGISNDGKIGTTATLPIITGTGGVLQAGAFGTGAGQFCQGNDSRLSDARTPTAHVLNSASHTVSGLTTGHVLRATGATTFGFAAITAGDLPTAIDAAKIANGTVSNAEFQYLDGVTSAIQAQLNGKASLNGTSSDSFQLGTNKSKIVSDSDGTVKLLNAAGSLHSNVEFKTAKFSNLDGTGMTVIQRADSATATQTAITIPASFSGTMLLDASTIDGGAW